MKTWLSALTVLGLSLWTAQALEVQIVGHALVATGVSLLTRLAVGPIR